MAVHLIPFDFMTRAITIFITGEDTDVLTRYSEKIADLVDDAMQTQEETHEIPTGLKYDGVSVVDPDGPEETETITPEVVKP